MKKWLVRIGVVLAVFLLFIAVVVGFFHIRGKVLLTKKIAELKAQGIPTTFAELEAKYKLPEGVPNAADIYLKAFAAYKPLTDEKQKLLPVMGNQPDPKGNEPYPPEQIAAAAEFVELNQEMFTLLHEAGKVESCYYPINYSEDLLPIINLTRDIKQASIFLIIAGIHYSQNNQPQKAYDALVDQLRLGQSICPPHHLFGHLVRLAILGLNVSSTQSIINRTSLSEAQLGQLQAYLQKVNQPAMIGPAFSGEICVCLEFRKLNREVRDVNELMFYAMCLTPQDPVTLIDTYQRMITIDELPIGEQLAKVKEVCQNSFFSLSKTALPLIKHKYALHLRIRASMNCAITALAIERYRLKEGKLPETVDELVPEYLPQVYIDPFDGKPLRYKQTGPGYMIYTIGEDGVDDGGLGPVKGRTYDWAFRVYR